MQKNIAIKKVLCQLFVCILILSNLRAAEKQITKIDNATISFSDMSEAILIHEIFPRLDPKDLANASEACRKWFYIIHSVKKITKNGFEFNPNFPFIKALFNCKKASDPQLSFEQFALTYSAAASHALAKQLLKHLMPSQKKLFKRKTRKEISFAPPSFVSDKPIEERNKKEIAELMLLTAAFGTISDFEQLSKSTSNKNISFINTKTPLHESIEKNNKQMIAYLLEQGIYNSSVDEENNNILHYAAKNRLLTKKNLNLISDGCNAAFFANLKNKLEETPLILALKSSNKEAVKNFCKITSLTSSSGNTPFHELASFQSPINNECLDIVRNAKVDINSLNKLKETALLLATKKQNIYLINYLLENGADPNTSNPLHFAAYRGFEEIVSVFAKHPTIRIDQLNELGQSALSITMQHKDEKKAANIMTILIQHGANIKAKIKHPQENFSCYSYDKGWPPLAIAVYLCKPDIVQFLLEQGASPDEQIDDRINILSYADIASTHAIIVQKLKQYSKKVN